MMLLQFLWQVKSSYQCLVFFSVCVAVCTKKDKLYNNFIGLSKEEDVTFPANAVNSSGKNFTKVMAVLVVHRRTP